MTIEVALVFDDSGGPIHWHKPNGASAGAIPDSRELWYVLWESRHNLGGVAHTHPWNGVPVPSQEDVTTFAAVEAGLGKRLLWPIITLDNAYYHQWRGPGVHDYVKCFELFFGMKFNSPLKGVLSRENVEELRRMSRRGG